MTKVSLVPLLLALPCLLAGCNSHCDPGHSLIMNLCVGEDTDDAATAADLASGADLAMSSEGGACTAPNGGYGAACAVTSDCPCGLDFCMNLQPGAVAYCTHTHCLDNPSICPAGFTCTDLSKYSAGLPAICTH